MSNVISDGNAIKQAVREHYGAAAEASASDETCCGSAGACCSDTSWEASRGYNAIELADLPQGATCSTRGCGNPLAIASLHPGDAVLDLGSGGGLDLLLASKQVGDGGYVYGVDMTDPMIALARRNIAEAGAANVEVLKGDIEALPLPDRSIDVVISNCVINLTPDKARALREAWRVLRPGGRLAITDVVIDGTRDDLPVGEGQLRAALSWAGCIAGALTSDEYRTLLHDAGFADIELAVTHRYGVAEVLPAELPDELAGLDQATLAGLVDRFTSTAITARRP